MKIQDLFENWGIKNLKFQLGIAEVEFEPQPQDQIAAWELYVELVTRVTTQESSGEVGDEVTALESVKNIFDVTREVLKTNGRKCQMFSRLAIILLNQILRPFTTKWHKISRNDGFKDDTVCSLFWNELREKQLEIRKFTFMLSTLANVDDLTDSSLFIHVESLKYLKTN